MYMSLRAETPSGLSGAFRLVNQQSHARTRKSIGNRKFLHHRKCSLPTWPLSQALKINHLKTQYSSPCFELIIRWRECVTVLHLTGMLNFQCIKCGFVQDISLHVEAKQGRWAWVSSELLTRAPWLYQHHLRRSLTPVSVIWTGRNHTLPVNINRITRCASQFLLLLTGKNCINLMHNLF